MKNFCCSGTAGDTYINVLKLYKLAMDEKVRVQHYTVHEGMKDTIREIYQLMPNIELVFLKQRGRIYPTIASHFETMESFIDVEPFPNFHLVRYSPTEFEDTYIAYAPKAGKSHEFWRKVPEEDIPKDGKEVSRETCESIEKAFERISNAREFMGYQGLMCFFALSQKVPTTVYVGPDHELEAFNRRVLPEWKEYIKEVKRV